MKVKAIVPLMLAALTAVPAALFARPCFDLPETLYAAPGLECNVYFSAAFDSVRPDRFAFEARGNVGKCESARWTWTPKAADAGKREQVVFNAWTDEGLVSAKTVTVVVAKAPADMSRKVTCALFGDSLTGSRYQDRLMTAVREAGWTNYTPVGTRTHWSAEKGQHTQPGFAPHDGYGGYTAHAFLVQYAYAVDEIDNMQSEQERQQLEGMGQKIPKGQEWRRDLLRSPIVRMENGKKVVDVQAWLDKVNGGKAPDVLLVQLGINGGCIQRDEQIAAHIDSAKKTLRRLIDEVRKVAPKTVVALATLNPGATEQDAFAGYGCSVSAVQCHKNVHEINRGYAELVAEMNAEGDKGIRLVPVGQAVDMRYGYPCRSQKPFVHSTETVERSCNAVHPNAAGGKQMGDAFAAWMLCELGDGGI